MDRPHQPHVIRTWTVERTRHPVHENLGGFQPLKGRKPLRRDEKKDRSGNGSRVGEKH
jgi:hypothetical protein